MSFISYSAFYAPDNVLCVCLHVCLPVSHLYGFGLLDAESMVKEAERWKQVPSQHECMEEAPIQLSRYHTNRTARDLHFESGLPLILHPFITLYLFLSQFSHGFLSHTLMGVIFFIAPFLVTLSHAPCFLPPLSSSSLPLTVSLYSFPLSLRLMTELFIQAQS